jgi:cytochrome b
MYSIKDGVNLMDKTQSKVKVWDFPTRFFHWSMLLLLAGLWLSAENGEMQWHQVFAYLLMILLSVRILWGLIGSETSRFTSFVVSPVKALAYLTTKPKPTQLGHNPLGGYMVVTMLAVLVVQLATGLFSTDEVFTEGPLYSMVDESLALGLTWVHKMNFNLLLALAGIHVFAVLGYLIKGDNLIKPMLTGYKEWNKHLLQPSAEPKMKSVMLALVILVIVAIPVWFVLLKPVIDFL